MLELPIRGAFVIVSDKVENGRLNGWIYGDKSTERFPIQLRLYDDDGELYYVAKASNWDYAELAHDWAQNNAGCTNSTYREGPGFFQPFIG